jgi:hypothetical protein
MSHPEGYTFDNLSSRELSHLIPSSRRLVLPFCLAIVSTKAEALAKTDLSRRPVAATCPYRRGKRSGDGSAAKTDSYSTPIIKNPTPRFKTYLRYLSPKTTLNISPLRPRAPPQGVPGTARDIIPSCLLFLKKQYFPLVRPPLGCIIPLKGGPMAGGTKNTTNRTQHIDISPLLSWATSSSLYAVRQDSPGERCLSKQTQSR